MGRLLDVGLEQLTAKTYKMGIIAQKAVELSTGGYLEKQDVNEKILELSNTLVAMSVEVEEKAFELIVKFQPVASDLRIVNSYIKIAYDFERFGRYAWDIISTRKRLGIKIENVESSKIMQSLIDKVTLMVSISVKALKDNDAELAKTLTANEQQVDSLYFELMDQLASSQEQIKYAMSDLLVAKFLERIADHTIYVAESIVYIITGEKVSLR